jgi:hypothetical protein
MKKENEIKRAFAMEVIEFINEMYINGKTHPFVYINEIKQKLYTMMRPDENESLLPKEEETKTESDEVKVDFKGDEFTLIHDNGTISWIHAPHQEMGMLVRSSELKPIQSLEQKARQKAEGLLSKYRESPNISLPDVMIEALLINPADL